MLNQDRHAMYKNWILTGLLVFVACGLSSQRSSKKFTFTAVDNGTHVQLDSIRVWGSGWGEMIRWPDTSMTYDFTTPYEMLFVGYATFSQAGIGDDKPQHEQFRLFQDYPDPALNETRISLVIPQEGSVQFMVSDIRGSVGLVTELELKKGHHSLRFSPGIGHLFLLSASFKGMTRSIKIIDAFSEQGSQCRLDYAGYHEDLPQPDIKPEKRGIVKESGILDRPLDDTTYTFQFAANIPCPGTPSVEYEGQVYNTVQIFSQCWFKENLNVGAMIDVLTQQSNNGIIEKYCHYNEPEEWKVLEGAMDSQYWIGENIWNEYLQRGFDAGTNMKTTSGWIENGNGTDLFGFSGLPAGYNTSSIGIYGTWWTATFYENPFYPCARSIGHDISSVIRSNDNNIFGFSVRCLRDN